MCYLVYVSTESLDDLSAKNSELVRFERVTGQTNEPCLSLLGSRHQWYVGSKSGCSCTFRHLASTELGFMVPVDWYEEVQEDIDATQELYSVLLSLVSGGHAVDVIDIWEGARPEDITVLGVSLKDVPGDAFMLFENHRFVLT